MGRTGQPSDRNASRTCRCRFLRSPPVLSPGRTFLTRTSSTKHCSSEGVTQTCKALCPGTAEDPGDRSHCAKPQPYSVGDSQRAVLKALGQEVESQSVPEHCQPRMTEPPEPFGGLQPRGSRDLGGDCQDQQHKRGGVHLGDHRSYIVTEDGLRSVYYLQIFTPNHCYSTAVSKGSVRVRSDSSKTISAVC